MLGSKEHSVHSRGNISAPTVGDGNAEPDAVCLACDEAQLRQRRRRRSLPLRQSHPKSRDAGEVGSLLAAVRALPLPVLAPPLLCRDAEWAEKSRQVTRLAAISAQARTGQHRVEACFRRRRATRQAVGIAAPGSVQLAGDGGLVGDEAHSGGAGESDVVAGYRGVLALDDVGANRAGAH